MHSADAETGGGGGENLKSEQEKSGKESNSSAKGLSQMNNKDANKSCLLANI